MRDKSIRSKLRNRKQLVWGFLLLVLLAVDLSAQAPPFRTTVAGDILQQFRNQRAFWISNIFVYANRLFAALALIEFAWSAAVMVLEKSDMQAWAATFIRKVMWLGVFLALLLNGQNWIPAIIDSFAQIGLGAARLPGPLAPGQVFIQGLTIAGQLMNRGSLAAFFANPGSSLALVLAAILTVISYIIITFNFIVTLVESYMTISVGFIFLGFGGSRWTAPYTERYISLAVSIGLKILLLYCLIGAGMNLAAGWSAEAATIDTSPNPMMVCFDIMGGALILMLCCWHIPKLFAAVLGGAISLTAGDALSPLATMAGIGMMGAGVIAGGVGAVAGGGAAAASTTAGGAAGSSAAGSMASTGASGAAAVNPPSAGGASIASTNGNRSVDPPASLPNMGGDALAGSGFEAEPPSSAHGEPQSNGSVSTSSPDVSAGGSTKTKTSDGKSAPAASGGNSGSARNPLYWAGMKLRRTNMQDQAHHATPPHMPLDRDD